MMDLKMNRAALVIAAALFGLPALAQAPEQQGTFGIEYGTGQVICTGDGDGQGEGNEPLDESYERSAAWDRMTFGADTVCGEGEARFTEIDEGTWARTQIFSGTDSAGRSADMRIYVLDDRFSWVFGSAQDIEEAGRPARFAYIFGRPMFLGEFCEGDAAVALGAASFEGEAALNRVLAGRRADTIGGEMTRLAGFCGEQQPAPSLYKVNLGEFTTQSACMQTGTCSAHATSPQRRVVIVGVDRADAGINLAEAVRDGLRSQTAQSVLKIDDYGLYEFGPL